MGTWTQKTKSLAAELNLALRKWVLSLVSSPLKLSMGAQEGSHITCGQGDMGISLFYDNHNSGNFVQSSGGIRNPRMSDIILDNSDEPASSCSSMLYLLHKETSRMQRHVLRLEKHCPNVSFIE